MQGMLENEKVQQEVQNTKQKLRMGTRKKIQLNWICTIALIPIIAMFITLSTFYIQPGSSRAVLKLIGEQPLILLVNYLPPLIALILLYFVINNLFYAAAITSFIFNAGSLVNRLKIELRDDPFVPRDFQLVQEAVNTVSDFQVKIKYDLLALIILAVIMFLVIGYFIKAKKLKGRTRIIGCVIVVIVTFFANKYIYSSKQVYYNKLHVSNRSYISRVFNELGFTYCFLYNLNSYPVEKPANFSKEEVEDLIKTYTTPESAMPEEKPNVIFIMNEAFSDIGMNEVFTYTPEEDPYKYWREITQSKNSIAGHIVVPGFGGGTANTEFDVMTGMQTNMLNSVPTSAFRVVGRNTQTIARVLAGNDYQTLFMHPGDSWFYNRYSVYKYFGMTESIFNEAFTKEDKKGNMVADSVLTQRIIEQFEAHTADDSKGPLFSYITSIQNHMPYTVRKYGDLPIADVQVSKTISQEAKDFLSVYMEGIRDANQMIKDLTDYFEAQDKPVVLVFFGDHLPNLGDNYLSYKELGVNVGDETSVENIINTYSTPYVIWLNEQAAQMINFEEKKETLDLPEDNRINANYLGGMVLELLGYSGQDPFFDYINELRKEVPVIYKENYKTIDEGYTKELEEYEQTKVSNFKNWEYYKMRFEKVE